VAARRRDDAGPTADPRASPRRLDARRGEEVIEARAVPWSGPLHIGRADRSVSACGDMRISINFFDASGAVVDQGRLSLHVKAAGDLTQTWSDGDYLDTLTRQGAHLTGGRFMGKPWLAMSSADVTDHEMWLLRYYDPAG
jgi:hypothetical protein